MVETMRTDRMWCRTLNKLQVSQSSKVDRKILMRRRGLIDNEDFKDNIELLNSDHSLGIYWIRESSKLDYSR